MKSNSVLNKIFKVLNRFRATLFVIIVAGLLAVAILDLNAIQIKASTPAEDYTPSIADTSFDQATIDRIEELRVASDTSDDFTLPQGVRTNPFTE